MTLISQDQQQVLDADIFVFKSLGFSLGLNHEAIESLRHINLAGLYPGS